MAEFDASIRTCSVTSIWSAPVDRPWAPRSSMTDWANPASAMWRAVTLMATSANPVPTNSSRQIVA